MAVVEDRRILERVMRCVILRFVQVEERCNQVLPVAGQVVVVVVVVVDVPIKVGPVLPTGAVVGIVVGVNVLKVLQVVNVSVGQ